ncbi:hypothetical protein BN1723_006770, partial [Verticillium longisporum]|uniref:AMP-dependent synthetase/ligase domain-containing protein n=1 Tax=Verticillium longisporum TaxID=100787 RepID=A0A0G4M0J6_VERLO
MGHSLNLINNARYTGQAMRLTEHDIVFSPPPLFRCFGLVVGFLASFCYGSAVISRSEAFNAELTLDTVVKENATALFGMPTMFNAELWILEAKKHCITTLRTGPAAGSPVPPYLMRSIKRERGFTGMLIGYGMMETSPVTFITSLDDSEETMLTSIGRVLPHTWTKVVDPEGNTAPIGQKGELCASGFALQKGYWEDDEKTAEVMRYDEGGVRWMLTGDEASIDAEGYAHITGRIKDIIIRDGNVGGIARRE